MKAVATTINKGGVGKTTLTKSLATAATVAGFNVVILDMDTQQNAESWSKRRASLQNQPLPLARFTTEADLADELGKAKRAGCDIAFIDTPPGRSSEALAAVEAADVVLVPFWNDQDAYEGVLRTSGMLRRMGKNGFGILNFATPNSRSHEDTARAVLETIGLPMAPVVLHRYDAHRLASIKGLTAQENEPDGVAATEVATLWKWLAGVLELGTGAPVHKKGKTK